MSGAFRLKDADPYRNGMGFEHTAEDVLQQAVYDLPEFFSFPIGPAKLVASPGCYATSVILPVAPIYAAGVIGRNTLVVANGKSGVSGAGRSPSRKRISAR